MSFIGDLLKAGISTDGVIVKMLRKFGLNYETATGSVSAVLSLSVPISFLVTSSGGGAFTLADGFKGQVKIIILLTKVTDSAVVTPANLDPGAAITFATAGQGCILVFGGTNWHTVGIYGGTIA